MKDTKSSQFERKDVKTLAEVYQLKLNITIVTTRSVCITLQASVSKRNFLATVPVSPFDTDKYVSQRALGANIANVCRPYLLLILISAAQHSKLNGSHAREMNMFIKNVSRALNR